LRNLQKARILSHTFISGGLEGGSTGDFQTS